MVVSVFQYDVLICEFKEIHKQSELLRQSGYNTADIKKDIASMEDEKEQLIKRVERLKRKVPPYNIYVCTINACFCIEHILQWR